MLLRLLPVILSALLLAAHFLRRETYLPALLILALLLILFVRKSWALRLWQAILGLGALVWIDTALAALRMRQAAGLPWMRMAAIMAAVTLLAIFSALWLENPRIKTFYNRDPNPPRP